jgi:peroxiredoxin
MTSDRATIPAVGDSAPDFTAESSSRTKITLSSFRGSDVVLIAFFPLAFTSTCTAQLCDFSAGYDQFARKGIVVLPISVDSTATLAEYRRKYDMKTELASDFRRDISRLYGVLNEERYYSDRAYFLVDRDGIIRWAHREEINRNKRTNEEILSQIERIL